MAGTLLSQIKRMQTRKLDPRSIALLEKSQGSAIWYDKELFPVEYHEAFFELLSKFELVYWMETISKYLVPSGLMNEHLSNENALVMWNTTSEHATKIRRLHFSRFFPIGLFHRLIVQILSYYHSKGDKFVNYAIWKSGIILCWEDVNMKIEQSNLAIQVHLQANNPYDMTGVDETLGRVISFIVKAIESNYPGKFSLNSIFILL